MGSIPITRSSLRATPARGCASAGQASNEDVDMNGNIVSAKAAPLKSSAASAQDENGPFPKHFVYVLRSVANTKRTYTGRTDNPKQRLKEHNEGDCPHTRKFRPWRMETLIGFTSLEQAFSFERYLKSGSGRAFAKKHFG
ncbi:MAG: GIY-YIG nuclease family protein [Kiritimatiellia bacterium]